MSVKGMLDFDYHVPATIDEALDLLSQLDDIKICGGGTDLVPKMKAQVLKPANILSLKNLKELDYLEYDESEGLKFGAKVPLRRIENFQPVQEVYPALYSGVHAIASTQIRNTATVVGNCVNAVPSADSAPSLLVLDAVFHIESKEGKREIPVDELFTGVCRTCLNKDELVTGVSLPVPARNSANCYIPFTVRRAMDLSMVGVACNLTMDGNVCKDIKIGLGAVAVTPKRARNAEALLIGKELTEELILEAAKIASTQDCSPITDMRATREYRIEMVRVLTKNAIKQCMKNIK